jgi:hypothetical protein
MADTINQNPGNVKNPNNVYWATKETDEIKHDILARIDTYYRKIQGNGHLRLWRELYKQYFRGWEIRGELKQYGAQGEKVRIFVNHFKNILQHILVMTTGDRPAFQAIAENTDYKSQQQSILANQLLMYYLKSKNVESLIKESCESALIFGEGWLYLEWDFSVGEDYVPPQMVEGESIGAGLKTGEIVCTGLLPTEVIRDYSVRNFYDNSWYIIRRYKNKYDLAAKYPDFADEIIKNGDDQKYAERNINLEDYKDVNSELIACYTFMHKKTTVLPKGRLIEMCGDGTIMFDGQLPTEEITLYNIVPYTRKDANFGISGSMDMLPLQQALDGLYSIIISNENALGMSNILTPDGCNISVNEIAKGLRNIKYNPAAGKPETLNLLNTNPEIFSSAQNLIQQMELISGINSITRGNVEKDLSGSAMALLQSMAIEYNSGLQNNYSIFLENLGSGIIDILKRYAKAPRIALIVGKSKQSYIKTFTGDEISGIKRVTVEISNPSTKTVAGKINLADSIMLKFPQFIRVPEQYVNIYKTGNVDILTDETSNELSLMEAENEMLMNGDLVQAIAIENHPMHIASHKGVLSNMEAKANAQVVQATLMHIQEHNEIMNPPMPPMPMGKGGKPGIPQTQQTQQRAGQGEPGMPNMPQNPLSKQPFNPQTGGM